MHHIELDVDPSAIAQFLPLLQKGVGVAARTGCSVRQFLCDQVGIADAYLDERVQTLFLDARPVDDVDNAIVHDGARLALSAAMPGLLGATMRKGGRYAPFRKGISLVGGQTAVDATDGVVTLKLFNMVAGEVGRTLLERGVQVPGQDLKRIMRQAPAMQSIRAMRTDGQAVPPTETFFLALEDAPLWLTLRIMGDTGED